MQCIIGDFYIRNSNRLFLALIGTKFQILYIIPEANDSLDFKYLTWEVQFRDSSNKTPRYFTDVF